MWFISFFAVVLFIVLILLMGTSMRYDYFYPNSCKLLLQDWSKMAKEKDLKWWAVFSSLLGATRQRDILYHDDTLDIGIYAQDVDKFREAALELGSKYHWKESGAGHYHFWSDEFNLVHINVFPMEMVEGKLRLTGKMNEKYDYAYFDSDVVVEKVPFGSVLSKQDKEEMSIGDMYINAPKAPADYLRRVYGRSWSHPPKLRMHTYSNVDMGIGFVLFLLFVLLLVSLAFSGRFVGHSSKRLQLKRNRRRVADDASASESSEE